MIRAITFIAKIAVLIALAVWVADRPGTVTIDWLGLIVTMHVGLFLLGLLGVILLAILLYRLLRGVSDIPGLWARYRREIGREKGYRALTLGLSAVAAGDAKGAHYHAFRAQKLMPEGAALGYLLKAQAARLEGDPDEALRNFSKLLEDKDAAFLGLRGMLQSALESKDDDQALSAARRALKLHPRQGWILKIAYGIEIRKRDFDNARKTLYRAEKLKVISAARALSDRIAMLLYESDQDREQGKMTEALNKAAKAYDYDRLYVPGVTRYAALLLAADKRRKAIAILEKAWKVSDHPDILDLWLAAAPKNKQGDKIYKLNALERMLALNPRAAEAHMALARANLDLGLWGEARASLKAAEEIHPSVKLYKMFVELEERSGRNESRIREYLQKSLDAPQDPVWLCRESGRIYKSWMAFAPPQDSFNTIVWEVPGVHIADNAIIEALPYAASVLEAPH